jgi:hypothetical protein
MRMGSLTAEEQRRREDWYERRCMELRFEEQMEEKASAVSQFNFRVQKMIQKIDEILNPPLTAAKEDK